MGKSRTPRLRCARGGFQVFFPFCVTSSALNSNHFTSERVIGACPLRLGVGPSCIYIISEKAEVGVCANLLIWELKLRLQYDMILKLSCIITPDLLTGFYSANDGAQPHVVNRNMSELLLSDGPRHIQKERKIRHLSGSWKLTCVCEIASVPEAAKKSHQPWRWVHHQPFEEKFILQGLASYP